MNRISLFILALICCVSAACQQKPEGGIPQEWPWENVTPQEPEKPVDPEDPNKPDPEKPNPDDPATPTSEWTEVKGDFGTLPEYIKLYKSPNKLLDQLAIAYIAEIDLTKKSFEVWGINAPTLQGSDEPLQTPSQVYQAQGQPAILINAGYFYTSGGRSYSSSLQVSNGTLLSPNINYASQDWTIYWYPTRAAFIEHEDGTYEVCWTYWKSAAQHYIYDVPAQNSWDKTPLSVPNESFPCEARDFSAKNAIGGSPVLIKDGQIKNTYKEELIEIGADGPAPRTAIGLKKEEKKLVLFVCEGRNMTEGVKGYTTEQVAQILLDFGCSDAVNLDGGGSTLMLVNGKEVLKPSDKKQRAVASCVYVK